MNDSRQRFLDDMSEAIRDHEEAVAPFIADADHAWASDEALQRVMTRAQRAMPRRKHRRLRASGPVSLKTRAAAMACALAVVGAMGATGLLTNLDSGSKPGVVDNAALVQYAVGSPCLTIEGEIAFLQGLNVNLAPINAQIALLQNQLDAQCGTPAGPTLAQQCLTLRQEIAFLNTQLAVNVGAITTRILLLQAQALALGCPP